MFRGNHRPLMAVAALAMAFAGGASLFFWQGSHAATGTTGPLIEVNEEGFNPPFCQIGRDDEVRWKNVGHEVHKIVRPPVGSADPVDVTADIQPGETSSGLIPGAGGQFKYQDA